MRQFSIPLTRDQRRSSGSIGCSTYEFRTLIKSKDNTTCTCLRCLSRFMPMIHLGNLVERKTFFHEYSILCYKSNSYTACLASCLANVSLTSSLKIFVQRLPLDLRSSHLEHTHEFEMTQQVAQDQIMSLITDAINP